MASQGVVINTSRGSVICEKDLVQALKDQRIGGAALDVYEKEPLSSRSALLGLKNVILSPHSAGGSTEAVLAMGEAAIDNLKKMV